MHDYLSKQGDGPVKSVVITGGNRGIGLDITDAFVKAGYFVVVGARQERGLNGRFGDRVAFKQIDVRNEDDELLTASLSIAPQSQPQTQCCCRAVAANRHPPSVIFPAFAKSWSTHLDFTEVP